MWFLAISSIFHFAVEGQPLSPDPDISGPSLTQELEAWKYNYFCEQSPSQASIQPWKCLCAGEDCFLSNPDASQWPSVSPHTVSSGQNRGCGCQGTRATSRGRRQRICGQAAVGGREGGRGGGGDLMNISIWREGGKEKSVQLHLLQLQCAAWWGTVSHFWKEGFSRSAGRLCNRKGIS